MPIPRNNHHVELEIQKRIMQDSFPSFQFHKKENYWIGKLKPTPRSPEYLIKLMYHPYSAPKVYVLSPVLHENTKHIYPDDYSLCLYYPDDHDWRGANLLASTILAWASEWLYCYEVWLASGEWIGEEAPHSIEKSPN